MKIKLSDLQQIVREEIKKSKGKWVQDPPEGSPRAEDQLEAQHPSEIVPLSTWEGGDNLHLDVDHPKDAGSEATTKELEILALVKEVISNHIVSLISENSSTKEG